MTGKSTRMTHFLNWANLFVWILIVVATSETCVSACTPLINNKPWSRAPLEKLIISWSRNVLSFMKHKIHYYVCKCLPLDPFLTQLKPFNPHTLFLCLCFPVSFLSWGFLINTVCSSNVLYVLSLYSLILTLMFKIYKIKHLLIMPKLI